MSRTEEKAKRRERETKREQSETRRAKVKLCATALLILFLTRYLLCCYFETTCFRFCILLAYDMSLLYAFASSFLQLLRYRQNSTPYSSMLERLITYQLFHVISWPKQKRVRKHNRCRARCFCLVFFRLAPFWFPLHCVFPPQAGLNSDQPGQSRSALKDKGLRVASLLFF